MFVRVDSFIYIFFLFLFFFLSHGLSFVLFYNLLILAFLSTVYRFVYIRGRQGRYPILVRFTTTYAISAYQR